MLTVVLETFYLGRINKLQLVFWDGLVIYSWSRMIWLASKELLHLGRQHPIYFQFWEKHYPLDKTLDQELRHSGSRLCHSGSRLCHSSGAWPHASLFTQMFFLPSPTLFLFNLCRCPWGVMWLFTGCPPPALAASTLLGERYESHAWTTSVNLVRYHKF